MNRMRVKRGISLPYPVGKLPAADLERLLTRYAGEDERVVVKAGIGKDATVISFGDRYLVVKTDPITFAIDEIGWYAVHINANDVAAMGGVPRWFLAAVLLPEGKTLPADAEAIFAQIAAACRELGVTLCGGHTEITGGLNRPVVVGQMLGEVEKSRLIVPENALSGDDIILTKGIAIEGTALIAREKAELARRLDEDSIRRCRNLLRQPGISVVREARLARAAGEVHAMHDPTEGGLATGLHELAAAAGVGLMVESGKIPILPETELICREFDLDPLGLIASGALLIVAPPRDSIRIRRALEAEGIRAALIGKIQKKEKGVKLGKKGKAEDLPVFRRDEVTRLFENTPGSGD